MTISEGIKISSTGGNTLFIYNEDGKRITFEGKLITRDDAIDIIENSRNMIGKRIIDVDKYIPGYKILFVFDKDEIIVRLMDDLFGLLLYAKYTYA